MGKKGKRKRGSSLPPGSGFRIHLQSMWHPSQALRADQTCEMLAQERCKSRKRKTRSSTHRSSSSSSSSSRSSSSSSSTSSVVDKKISRAYSTIGGSGRSAYPRSHRLRLLRGLDKERFAPVRTAMLSFLQVDMAIFVATGLPPSVKLRDLHCKNLRQLQRALQDEMERLGHRQQSLTWDFSNLQEVANSLGWRDPADGGELSGEGDPASRERYKAYWQQYVVPKTAGTAASSSTGVDPASGSD